MFSSPCKIQSCVLLSKTKYIACLLLTALLLRSAALPQGGCPSFMGTVGSPAPRLLRGLILTHLFQTPGLTTFWPATRRRWTLDSQASFLEQQWRHLALGLVPQLYLAESCPSSSLNTANDELASTVTLVSPYKYLIMSIMLCHVLVITFYCMPIIHFSTGKLLYPDTKCIIKFQSSALHIQFMPKPCYYGGYIWTKPHALIIYPVHGWYLRPRVAHTEMSTSAIPSRMPRKERNT